MAAKHIPDTLDLHLCFKLYSTSLKMTQLYKPMLAALNLTYPQYLVMVILWEEEGLGIKDLAERLGQDPGSITPLVKRLEAVGYVNRDRDPNDERNRVLTLTDAGKALRKDGCLIQKHIAESAGIPVEQVQRMMDDLSTLNANLAATLGDALHQLGDLVGVEPADRDVVEEEQGLGALGHDVVAAHIVLARRVA